MRLLKHILRRGIFVRLTFSIDEVINFVKGVVGRRFRHMRKINKIIIHCSDSTFGDAATIRRWHIERGFSTIGYHYVILNGHRTYKSKYDAEADGLIELGRPVDRIGAHCKGHNRDSIGICLIGKPEYIGQPEEWFTEKQLSTLKSLVKHLLMEFNLSAADVYGHNDFAPKICPGFKVEQIRDWWNGQQ